MSNREIGERIRKIRKSLRLNQTEFGARIGGLAASSVSAYEKGETVPPSAVLSEIASLGEVTIEGILRGGAAFESTVSRKLDSAQGKLVQAQSPSDFGAVQLVELLEQFKQTIGESTENLLRAKQEHQGEFILSEQEERLITAFRQLESKRKLRLIEDAEEWAALSGIEIAPAPKKI